jgi:hypothetical protein
MSDTVETFYSKDRQRRVRIEYDMDSSDCDPRQYDELVQIVTRDHNMTEHTDGAKFESEHDRLYEKGLGGAFGRYLKIFHGIEAFKVFKFEHGNVALSLGDFRDRWDSGMIGWAYLNPDAEQWEGIEPKEVIGSMLGELAAWMNGEVYGYIVEHRVTGRKVYDGDAAEDEAFEEWVEEEDGSCWGHIGYDWAVQAAKTALGEEEEQDG